MIKHWLEWHFPIVTTHARQLSLLTRAQKELDKMTRQTTWAAIRPVIYDLEALRADTWNQDKITHIQQWLRNNFESEDDEKN